MKKIKEIRQRIRHWHAGKLIENDPNSGVVFIGFDRPWLAIKYDELVKWMQTHWPAFAVSVASGAVVAWLFS